jgi:4-hydroxybenzoate polyprenyltransferase
VWSFRLWDDLEDLGFDRLHHPERTLVLSESPRAFVLTAVAGILLAGVAVALAAGAALVYACLVTILAIAYRLTRRAPRQRLARAHVVLAKYPAFVFLAAWQPLPARAAPAAALLYLVLCLIEIAEDPVLRAQRRARAFAVAEGIAIAGIIIVYGAAL